MFNRIVSRIAHLLILIIAVFSITPARPQAPDDWPMWRHDAGHTASTPHALPAALDLQWSLDLGSPEPAWPWTQDKLLFDAAAEPVVLGDTIFIPSSRTDSVSACDLATGALHWRFFAQGPVRFAPVAAQGKVWFGSDDGCLYCLEAATGALAWKFRAVPSGHKTLGNERIVSTWPVRGGPVLADGRICFAAGIWPSMGIYVYALDAATGKKLWLNSGRGSVWQDQPHAPSAKSFSGIAPQGALAAAGDKLLVPSGRALPGVFELATGRFLYERLNDRIPGKDSGGHAVAAAGDFFFCGPGHNRLPEFGNSPGVFALADGKALGLTRATVVTPDAAYQVDKDGALQALDVTAKPFKVRWSIKVPGLTEVFCKAGPRLYAGGPGKLAAIDEAAGAAAPAWEKSIEGTPASCLAARGRLVVSTLEGKIYCFASKDGAARRQAEPARPRQDANPDSAKTKAQKILEAAGQHDGYCFVAGAADGAFIEELVAQSSLRVTALAADAALARALRERWAGRGLGFRRACVLEESIATAQLPPYVASLIVVEDPAAAPSVDAVGKIFNSLRPYGGKACFAPGQKGALEKAANEAKLESFRVTESADCTLLERVGPLPGAGSWTHNYGDAANSVFSTDKLARAPLGILWYGGNDHENVLPRHGHGPTEQVLGGRLFIEGRDFMSARDVYTGRVLWERRLEGIGASFDNTSHEAGANAMGSNFATAEDGVYVAYGFQGLRLDPATGQTLTTFTLKSPAGEPLEFAQFKLEGDVMVVSAGPHGYDKTIAGTSKSWNETGSKFLFAMDRRTGRTLWQREAVNLFHHNSVIIAGGTVYAIDRLAPTREEQRARRGEEKIPYTLLALGLRDGAVKWQSDKDVFGTWLGCSVERGILIQSGRRSKDMALGEVGGRIMALKADSGHLLWDRTEKVSDGPYILYHDMLIMQDSSGGWGIDLSTGKDVTRPHPVTGQPVRWQFARRHGCNTALASENLLTFRSGAIGYYDMVTLGGTANFGGVKSGCTPCLVVADGVVNAPDYTRTCICAYQNQCSLALVSMPGLEMWTYGGWAKPPAASSLARIGINFGAIGDRPADSGTLWVDYPSIGFDSPDPQVQVEPAAPRYFRSHSLAGLPPEDKGVLASKASTDWITASGAIGIRKVTVKLDNPAPRPYTVRLYFTEPEDATPGRRVFDVALQGRRVLANFDIARETTASSRGVIREFKNIPAGADLVLTLEPTPGEAVQESVLCGMELIAE